MVSHAASLATTRYSHHLFCLRDLSVAVVLGGHSKQTGDQGNLSHDISFLVVLQKIWKEGDGREAFLLASFTLPLETSWRCMQLDR